MKITFIGAGHMAGAIIGSMIHSGRALPKDITVYDVDQAKYAAFEKDGLSVAQTRKEACEASPVIVLAVRPQDYPNVLSGMKEDGTDFVHKILVSIAAGISTNYVCRTLNAEVPVVRVMPNTPLLIGCGATAISRNALVADKDFTRICGIFASAGVVSVLPEDQMNAVIAVNATSPAYVYLLAKAMIDKAVEDGIDRHVANELVCQTIKGSAMMLQHTKESPDELICKVASPGGTTEAALKALLAHSFEESIQCGMQACTDRAYELKL